MTLPNSFSYSDNTQGVVLSFRISGDELPPLLIQTKSSKSSFLPPTTRPTAITNPMQIAAMLKKNCCSNFIA